MQISVSNLQICWLTAFNICLHLCCTVYALLCRMFISVLISFPFHWPFQIKCNSSAEFEICIIIRQPRTTLLSSGPWGSALTWLTHSPFLLCDDNVTQWVRVPQLFQRFSQNSLIVRPGSRSWLIWDLTLRTHPHVQIKDLNSHWFKVGRPSLPLAAVRKKQGAGDGIHHIYTLCHGIISW